MTQDERVWQYLLEHRATVTVEELAMNCDITPIEAEEYFARISSPNWRETTTANARQVGGSHYKDMKLQPWQVMEAVLTPEEFRGFLKGNIIKYAMRQGKKDSDDAGKADHYIAKLKEMQR